MRNCNLSEKEKIRLHFNRAEHSYDEHCQLQIRVGKTLIAHTQQIKPRAERILDIGCGTGIITQLLSNTFNANDVHAFDIAERLLATAKTRLNNNTHVFHADFDDAMVYTHPFDLVFSNMALQWSADLTTTLRTIKLAMQPNSLLAFSIPIAGTLFELQEKCTIKILSTLQSIQEQLMNSGYTVLLQQQEQIVLSFNDTLSALQSIKNIGANYVSARTHTGLRGKAFLEAYDCRQLTYQIGFFIVT